MFDVTILQAIKKFIQEQIADKVQLQKPPDEGETTIEYVKPYVCIGYLPPKNFLPEEYDIPGIIVGLDPSEDNGSEAHLKIRITFATYGAGTYDESGNLIPDMEGYIDLLNLIGLARQKLSTNPFINGSTVAQKPFKWGMYEEQPWPYWYGWLTFSVNIPVQDMVNTKIDQHL